jgi:DNA polymerase-3 subunit gamma/tau
VGKTSVARILAKALNCEHGPTKEPCGKCVHCLEIDQGRAVDVQEIDAASNSRVEDVRELREVIRYRPQSARFKVTILDEVHMLSKAAFNALLKTLEEPPEHAVFILATTDVHKVPLTILSRCQRYDFRRLSPAVLAAHMASIIESEGCKMQPESLNLMAREADGSVRDSLSILDQVLSVGKKEYSHQEVVELLGLVDKALVQETARAVLAGDASKVLELVGRVYGAGGEMQSFYAGLQEHFRNLAAARDVAEETELFGLTQDELADLKKEALSTSPETLHEIFDVLARSEDLFRRAAQPRLVMEMTLLKLTQVKPVLGLDQIVNRLAAIAGGEEPPPVPGSDFGSLPDRGNGMGPGRYTGSRVAPETGAKTNPAPMKSEGEGFTPSYQGPGRSQSGNRASNGGSLPSYTGPTKGAVKKKEEFKASYQGPASEPVPEASLKGREKKIPPKTGNKLRGGSLPPPEKTLQELCRYAGRSEPSLASYLSRSQAEVQEDKLVITLPSSPLAASCATEENQAKLEEMLAELYGAPVSVVLKPGAAPESVQEQGVPQMELLNELANHSAVQEALEVFEAQVVSLNPERPSK